VIAAVNGHAVGGGLELALACDIRIAGERAWCPGAGVNVGLMASVYRLPRLIGIEPAKAMLLTGTRTPAATALHYGLVTAVHSDASHAAEALTLVRRIATPAPLSVEASKRAIGQAFDLKPHEAADVMGREMAVLAQSNDRQGRRGCLCGADRTAIHPFINVNTGMSGRAHSSRTSTGSTCRIRPSSVGMARWNSQLSKTRA